MKNQMYGHRARIGYTSPPMLTEVFPYEFYKIAPPGVTVVVTSLAVLDVSRAELQSSYDISVNAAHEMAKGGVDLVILGGVPVNSVKGVDKIDDLMEELTAECGIPVRTSAACQVDALHAVGAKRVASISPGEDAGGIHDEMLQFYGFETMGTIGGGYRTGRDWGRAPADLMLKLARELVAKYPDADTINVRCPHWATIECIEPIEQELGINVITASQAIIWEGLRRCEVSEKIEGYGRLLLEH